jgi:hypothetical protein
VASSSTTATERQRRTVRSRPASRLARRSDAHARPADGDWYTDDRIVFGIVLDGEAVALPKHIMEVHELVNLTIAGRRIGVPYCTLCASAQAFLTDAVPAWANRSSCARAAS